MDITAAYAYLKRLDLTGGEGSVTPNMFGTAGVPGAGMPIRVFSAEAAVFYLVDQGDSFEYVQEAHLDAAGMTVEELHQIATRNLDGLVPTMQIHDLGSSLMLSGNGSFEASMILSPAFWETVGGRFPNGVAVAMPARDVFVLCDRDDDAALAQLRDSVTRIWQVGNSHLLAQNLYEPTHEGTWSPIKDTSADPAPPASPDAAATEPECTETGMSDEDAWQRKLTIDAADASLEAAYPGAPRVREPRMDILLKDGTEFTILPAYLVATGEQPDGLLEFLYVEVQAVEGDDEVDIARIGDGEAVFLAAHLNDRVEQMRLSGRRYEALFGDRQGVVTKVELRGLRLVDS